MTTILRAIIDHHIWANDTLLTYCEGLTPEQLALSVPGTYGGTEATLVHIALNEEHYLRLIDRGGVPTGISTTILDGTVPRELASVRPVLERTAAAWREVVDRHAANHPLEVEWEGEMQHLSLSDVVTQVVEHGAEHRTHIRTTLAAHGIAREVDEGTTEPDLSVWAWQDARTSAS